MKDYTQAIRPLLEMAVIVQGFSMKKGSEL